MKGAGDFARQEEAVAACCSKRLLVIVLLASSFLVQHGQATLVKIAVNNDINQYLFYELDVDNVITLEILLLIIQNLRLFLYK